MSGIMLLISVVSTLLFALVVLVKLGVPVIVAVVLAIVAGYAWWRMERADTDKHALADSWHAFSDIKDIVKYVNQLL